jgi:hypothetical protein
MDFYLFSFFDSDNFLCQPNFFFLISSANKLLVRNSSLLGKKTIQKLHYFNIASFGSCQSYLKKILSFENLQIQPIWYSQTGIN